MGLVLSGVRAGRGLALAYDTQDLKDAFLANPWPLLQRLGLRVDERRTDRKNLWVYDGDETQASLAIQTTGEHAGTWTRFGADGDSGDCFTLVQRFRGSAPFPELVAFVADAYNALPTSDPPAAQPKNGKAHRTDAKVVGSHRYELRDEAGQIVAVHCRLDLDDGTKRMWYERGGERTLAGLPPSELPLYRLPDLLEDVFAAYPVVIVEGEKAADALAALAGGRVIALGTACGAGNTPAPPVLAHLTGRDIPVCLWPDNDAPGLKHMTAIAEALRDLGVTDLRWIAPPAGLAAKDDAADWCEGHTLADLLALIDAAPAPSPPTAPPIGGEDAQPCPHEPPTPPLDGQPTSADGPDLPPPLPMIIAAGVPLQDVTRRALETVIEANDPPRIYVRDAQLTFATRSEDGRATLLAADEGTLRGVMARAARYVRMKRSGDEWVAQDIAPPLDAVRDFPFEVYLWAEERGHWPFPPITGVTECPVLRPDGSVCDTPGYDPVTRLYYLPAPDLEVPPIPEQPTSEDLADAWGRLEALLQDFPFADGASGSNAIALMLTAVARPCIPGPTPLCLIDAPQAGTGKSLLVDVISHIATGRYAAMLTAPTREEEWRKQLTSVLLTGQTFVVIDNVTRDLDSGALSTALTSATISDRLLGHSRQIELPVRCTWAATGNNIRLGQDMPRRCYWVRLDARQSRPWQGRTFAIPDLREHVARERGALLAALLTIARAWYAAGRPSWPSLPIIGSFEPWCRIIGGMMRQAGDCSFLRNLDALHERAAEADNTWEAFLRAWLDTLGTLEYTIRDLAAKLDPASIDCAQAMEEALPPELCDRNGALNRRRLAWGFRRMEGVRFGSDNLRLERAGTEGHSKAAQWRVATDQ